LVLRGVCPSHFRRTYVPYILTLPAYLHAACTHTPCVCWLSSRYPLRLAWSRRSLFIRLAWCHCSRCIRQARLALRRVRTHTLCVISSAFSHALLGLAVLVVSVTPRVVSSRSSHTPCVGSLFSWYSSRPAWSRRGLLTRLAWARCSCWGWWLQRRFTNGER